jgi:hypothetical protein
VDSIAGKQRALDEMSVGGLTLGDVGMSFQELMERYQAHYEPVEGTLEMHSSSRGLGP